MASMPEADEPQQPASEELPPELPKAPPSSGSPDHATVLAALRELLERSVSEAPEGRVLAVLGASTVLKSAITHRIALAGLCGYESELEFFEESEPVVVVGPRQWFATPDKAYDGWVLWCDENGARQESSQDTRSDNA